MFEQGLLRFGVASFATSKLKAGLRPAWQGKSLAFSTTKSGDFAEPGQTDNSGYP
jgi:hypothetical protein